MSVGVVRRNLSAVRPTMTVVDSLFNWRSAFERQAKPKPGPPRANHNCSDEEDELSCVMLME